MVKFSNGGRGKPSKRQNLKTKYKIQRRVKQYHKKVKKQAKKMKQSGIKHKKNPDRDVLPNLFPFKNQMLLDLKSALPKEPEAPIEVLNSAEFGLVTMQNKPVYFPKNKDNLTKKYITNIDNIFKKTKIVLQLLDSRFPQICIDEEFRALCKKNKIIRIPIITKIDTIFQKKLTQIEEKFTSQKEKVLKFTHDPKHKKQLIEQIVKTIQSIKQGFDNNQTISIFIAGKSNTGKHTLINMLCKYAGKYQDIPSQLFELVLMPGVKIIDAPYKIQDKTMYPLFHTPNELNQEQSINSQEQTLIKHLFFGGVPSLKSSVLNRNGIIQYYQIQDYISIEDLCKKVGKSLRVFGKGGMIDVAKVKQKILTEWFTGRLNKFINAI